jgi:serine/threonine protein kinase
MNPSVLDDLLDGLVAEYSGRLARGERSAADLLERVPAEHRPRLERVFGMMEAGSVHAPRSAAGLQPGAQLDKFRIVREIGRGGMAVVYLATQLDLARPVALKVLRAGLSVDKRHVERFQREALAVARLNHPHIVQVHAVGEAQGWHYLAMEYVEGPTLAEVYERLPPANERTAEDLARLAGLNPESVAGLSYERALCQLLAPVARALATTHELGLLHRDVKPSNILIKKGGQALIADFGLAKGDNDPGLSLTGEPVGTPFYMSPEQALLVEVEIDQRTDVYSLGVTLYEGLAGRRPFEGRTALAVLDAVRNENAPPLRMLVPRTTRDADAVVGRAMAHEREERYPSALEFAADLSALADGAPTQARARNTRFRGLVLRIQAVGRHGTREYRSEQTFLGLPLVHINFGPRGVRIGRRPVARGWLAIGDIAIGVLAFGGMSVGVFTFGGLTLGLVAFGGLAAGGLALGGLTLGAAAVGGVACGYYAFGGATLGAHVINGIARDPAALEFFGALPGIGAILARLPRGP